MRESSKKDETRARILKGAASAFRGLGYGGAGVDGVAKAAGVTSGAFYANFKSKAEAFKLTVVSGMRDLNEAVTQLREQQGGKWVDRFVSFYLTDRRTCPLTESCALQSLTGDVSRADEDTRDAFEAELRTLLVTTADGLTGTAKERRSQAIVMLALLSGGVSLARAVNDPALSEEIAAAIRSSLKRR